MGKILLAMSLLLLTLQAPAQAAEEEGSGRSFSAQLFGTFVPHDRDFLMPIFAADLGSLHLEARHNYEAMETASLWAGWTFGGGESLEWEFTPMVGGLTGDLDGWAAGFEASLSWRWLEFYDESELVIAPSDSESNFFYSWSELTVSPVEGFRVGLAGQRTRLAHFGGHYTPGLVAAYSLGKAEIAGYIFDTEGAPTAMVSVRWEF